MQGHVQDFGKGDAQWIWSLSVTLYCEQKRSQNIEFLVSKLCIFSIWYQKIQEAMARDVYYVWICHWKLCFLENRGAAGCAVLPLYIHVHCAHNTFKLLPCCWNNEPKFWGQIGSGANCPVPVPVAYVIKLCAAFYIFQSLIQTDHRSDTKLKVPFWSIDTSILKMFQYFCFVMNAGWVSVKKILPSP